jgi:5-methylcytosine-specific restriction endonuclease McrA
MADFLFTWNPKVRFPYEELRKIVDRFDAGEPVVEGWQCAAHVKIRVGDRAYLFKQGKEPRGVFGLGRVDGPPKAIGTAGAGKRKAYEVPIRFELLLDPTSELLITKDALLRLGVSDQTLNHQASGFTFTPRTAARRIDELAAVRIEEITAANDSPLTEEAQSPEERERRREMRLEAYRRDSKLVRDLKILYDGRCQICTAKPFDGRFGALTEGHHIEWLCRGGADSGNNVVLLCPNHHAAMHEMDPRFDRPNLAFHFGSNIVRVALDRHLTLG